MQKFLMPLVFVLVAAVFLVMNSAFTVSQTEQVLVRQFGEVKRNINQPGLYFKVPFVQDIVRYDNRLLDFNAEPIEVIAGDTKRIIVDAFVRYRIVDAKRFLQAIGPDAEMASARIGPILESSLRQAIGNAPLAKLLSDERDDIMEQIRELVSKQAAGVELEKALEITLEKQNGEAAEGQAPADADTSAATDENAGNEAEKAVPAAEKTPARTVADGKSNNNNFGVEIIDVRIMRADLPQENSEATFRRMQTEREREAKEFRAKGEEEAQRIRSRAERERTVILAEAQKNAQITRGEGDAEAARIYAESFSRDPQFFAFYRSMQAYRNSLGGENTRIILSPEGDFLNYLQDGKRP
jgi:membrane protease subunit HflC